MRTESRELLAVGIFSRKSRIGDRIEMLLLRGRTFSPRVSATGSAERSGTSRGGRQHRKACGKLTKGTIVRETESTFHANVGRPGQAADPISSGPGRPEAGCSGFRQPGRNVTNRSFAATVDNKLKKTTSSPTARRYHNLQRISPRCDSWSVPCWVGTGKSRLVSCESVIPIDADLKKGIGRIRKGLPEKFNQLMLRTNVAFSSSMK